MHLSAFDPATPEAAKLLWLWNACMYVCIFILAVVTLSILYILVRYRRRSSREPRQTTGNKALEITWTAVPLGLVALLFVWSVMTARAVDRPLRAPDIVVTGHQWWWEVRYPAAQVITANEVHLPQGSNFLLQIDSVDVVHDYWVPRLSRKVDAVPGKSNFIWMTPQLTGVFSGFCAEYCGNQHAWMLSRAVVQNQADYTAWLAHQSEPAKEPAGGDASAGRKLFGQLTCTNCHTIRGISEIQKEYGPDLTHLASRQMLAGERIANTPENLRDWLHQPQVIKPGCFMPTLKLSDQDLTQLTAFLETLQ